MIEVLMKNRLSKITEIFFVVFVILLCLSQLKWFYQSWMTLLLLIGVLILTILYFIKDQTKNRKKHLIYLCIYGLLGIFYLGISHIHHSKFTSLVPSNFDYHLFSELLYFIKMSVVVVMLFLFSKLDISKKYYRRVIFGVSCFMSLSIIIPNLLGISYGSYSDQTIRGNFFTWFTDGYQKHTFYHLASKGFFYSANQVSAILLLLFPVLLYYLIKTTSWKVFVLTFLQVWAMFLLGTRTAIYGSILMMAAIILLGLFYTFWKKEIKFQLKNLIYFNILILFVGILFPFSPIHSRKEVQENINHEGLTYALVEQTDDLSPQEMTCEDKITYIEENYEEKRILEHFIIRSYPYIYDPDFWYDVLQLPTELRTDYRYLEKQMLDRVIEINHNPYDKWLGISYTRVQNIFNLEQDFLVQYYSVGICGMILFLSGYFVMIAKISFDIVKKKLSHCFLPLCLLCASCVFLAISYFSGNLLNSLMVTPYLCLILGYATKEVREGEQNEK